MIEFSQLLIAASKSEYTCGKWDQLFDDQIASKLLEIFGVEDNCPIGHRKILDDDEYFLFDGKKSCILINPLWK